MRLPNGYTELEYIQSTGTQYIDMGFKATENTKIEAKFHNEQSANSAVFGADKAWTQDAFGIWINSTIAVPVVGTVSGTIGVSYSSAYDTFTLDKNTLKLNGGTIWTASGVSAFQTPTNVCLGAVNRNGTVSEKFVGRMYYCKAWESDTFIRNCIPCINPNGEAGLYDTVNSKFYGNAGTGVFLAGPPKVTLPKGYIQLEYIQSSGTQYVDTNVKPTQAFLLDISIQTLQTTSGGIAVSDQTWGTNGFGVWCNAAAFGSQTKQSLSLYNDAPIVIKLSQSGLFLNGSSIWTVNSETFTVPANMYLFALNRNGIISEKLTGKLYSCKLYDNATLIRDFIPCKNDAGAIGLYDLVNSKFYGNAGTGAFTAGPEVIWPSNDAIYVKVNGIWKQIDGIKIL